MHGIVRRQNKQTTHWLLECIRLVAIDLYQAFTMFILFPVHRERNHQSTLCTWWGGRPRLEDKWSFFIGQPFAPCVQICVFPWFCHHITSMMAAGWCWCIIIILLTKYMIKALFSKAACWRIRHLKHDKSFKTFLTLHLHDLSALGH